MPVAGIGKCVASGTTQCQRPRPRQINGAVTYRNLYPKSRETSSRSTPLWNMEDSMTTSRTTVKRNVVVALIATVVSIPLSGQGPAGSANRAGAGSTNRSAVAPRFDLVKRSVDEAYARYRSDTSGKNADYIPYLAQVDSKLFGISAVTTDNEVYTLGDVIYFFSILSISKVFTLSLAMEELGADSVFDRIGSEPTGRALNSVDAVVD